MEPSEMEQLWDAVAALATMTDDAEINNVPVRTGARGSAEVLTFYRDDFIPSWPDDVEMQPRNRVVGGDQLVDEIHVSFSHTNRMDWLLPGVPPTNRRVELDAVIFVQFRDGKIAGERVYWDQAAVLHQVGLVR